MIAGVRVPAEREGVHARHRPVPRAQCNAGVEQRIREGVGDDLFDSGSGDHLLGPPRVGVAAADIRVERLPVLACDAGLAQ